MRPTLPAPNEFELAILRRLASKLPALSAVVPKLRVVSRRYTPCGSYTRLDCRDVVAGAGEPIGLSEAITMPGVAYGMDGVLFFKDSRPDCLEIVTFGGEPWDGHHDGFSIPPAA
ncbi:MAG: putative integron cassette protein [Phycisphaerales bacterium]|nr:putative integron cassette protein [Phycisphaerales bacterium]